MEKMVEFKSILNFYKSKRVLVTGHTGFKGSWLCKILIDAGADVIGYSLESPTTPSLFELSGLKNKINSIIGDICDYDTLERIFDKFKPEIVLHLAAQPIVLTSYREPKETYAVNVMGTVNVLECCRMCDSVKSILNVTTDKVYENKEWHWGYRENESLNGYDPYSNSKSCSELVTQCYINSFFKEKQVAVSTARAGNVIGGGDFADKRIIPDCLRAVQKSEIIAVRNPYSIRPYQHVLEPLFAYLMIAKEQYDNINKSGNYNIGPDECDCVRTGELVDIFCQKWGGTAKWENQAEANAPHEAKYLKLDCSKLKMNFGWKPNWNIDTAIEKTCEWSKVWLSHGNIEEIMSEQIRSYIGTAN